jgi:D-serine deaminase-like pyridoxal phosphate-dependent protein
MALSRDTGLPWKREEFGYGLVCDEAGKLIPGLRVTETNQEHGIVSGPSCPALPAGSRLRILPIHACATAACFDSYTVLREGRISGRLERCRGW